MKRIIQGCATLLMVCIVNLSIAGEGMWLPLLLKAMNEKEMQSMGMKMTAEDIYSVNQGSLKDAIVHFGGFCTSELISAEGLLLTNHHCGYSAIQSHTTLENNYLKNGFWAPSKAAELPNPSLSATFIVRIEDITETILKGVTDDMPSKERQSTIDKNIDALEAATDIKEYEDIIIRPFFKGNQYFMFITMTYNDVRLVGAPPDAIGKFGADTDNWVWPRHTGDFSLFRIYAGPDNLPADYSEDNVPFKPKHFLPISLDGVETGDFTLVFGFPGRTNQYLPSDAMAMTVDVLNPARIGIRDKALEVIDAAMRADEQVRIQYASKQARIANAWKKWQGENLGIETTGGLDRKHRFEEEFMKRVNNNPEWKQKYGKLLADFKARYTQLTPYAKANAYYGETIGFNIELMRSARLGDRLIKAYENNGEEGYNNFKGRLMPYYSNFYKDYSAEVDQKVFAALMEHYAQNTATQYHPEILKTQLEKVDKRFDRHAEIIYKNSAFANAERIQALLALPPAEAIAKIKDDPAYQTWKGFQEMYAAQISDKYNELQDQISDLQRHYMKAIMTVFPERRFFPDANSTLRVTYGKVNGYQPRDAVSYQPKTYLSGVIEKYKPGDYEFDVPEKLRQLEQSKDYGPYGEEGQMPVCFIGTNHTTGGNSGSPAIDAHGNLIGLNFDRAWEGTMSDINYDASICRNIMVDIRYVLFIIDKYADAGHLIEEMKLVHPKKK
ncbi:MAG: S46 family peptidase [Bacteroidota bacterium]